MFVNRILARVLGITGMLAFGMLGSLSLTADQESPAKAASAGGTELCVISYNILEGFANEASERYPAGSERQARVSQWLAEQTPDIVALQELNGYSEARLAKESQAWGHGHAATVKEKGYIVGLTSREPIEVVERHLEGMHHGVLHARTMGIDCFVVHLSPFRFEHRQREAAMILQRVKEAESAGRPVLVLGDFNAFSPLDRSEHEKDEASLERMRASDLKHDHIENLNQGQFDYTVMQAFLDAGLVDLYAQGRKAPGAVGRKRIDFILASPDLAGRLQSAGMFTGDAFRAMSDHPPVVALFSSP